MKKIYITLGILLLATFAMAYLYFSNLNTENNANDLSLNAVAKNSGIVFSFENDKSFYEILSGQDLLQNVLGETKSKQLKNLRENLIDLPSIFNAIDGQKVYIGILPSADSVNFMIGIQLKTGHEPAKLLSHLNSKNIRFKKTGEVYELTFSDSTHVFFASKEKLVLISNSPSALTPILTAQTLEDQDFAKYIKANTRVSKNTLANLYIDFNKTPALLKNILSNNINGELNIFKDQHAYAALSYSFGKEKLLFNGNTTVEDPKNYFNLFSNLPEQQLTIDNIMPEKTANYAIYAIADYKTWQNELNKWMLANQQEEKVKQNIDAINQKYRIDLRQIFSNYFKNQFATFQLNSGEKFGAIALSNGEKLGQFLLDLSGEYAPDIKIFKDSNIPFAFFGEPFKKFERPFYTIIDNYLVMANNASSIQVFLNSYKANKLLVNDEAYIGFGDQLSSAATIVFYVNHKNSNDIFGRNLKIPYYKQYQSKTGFNLYNAFCYQLSGDHGKFLSNLLLYKRPEKIIIPDTTNKNQ